MGKVDLASLGSQPLTELTEFAKCETPTQLNELLFNAVTASVAEISTLVGEADAFDAIELMRLREVPMVPIAALQAGFDGSAAAIELIALVLLARGARRPSEDASDSARPHEAIPRLHEIAMRLLRLSTFKLLVESGLRQTEPLARVAAEYQSHLINVRSMQYSRFQDDFDKALFDNPVMDRLMANSIGFTYAEFQCVRSSVQDFYSEKLTATRDLLGEVAVEWDHGRVEQSPDRIAQGRQAMIDFIFLPGNRAQFNAAEISLRSGLDGAKVALVLDAFTLRFDASDTATDRVLAFLRGRNPFSRRPLVADADGNYVMTSLQIGTDSLRRVVEDALKSNNRHWRRYDKLRMEMSEGSTLGYLAKALDTAPQYAGLKYFASSNSTDAAALGKSCGRPADVAELVEADGLFLIEDVAICVEVKARSISEQSRRGDVVRLGRELDATIGAAAAQARRLEHLIETNGGLWRDDGSWLDLSHIREVRSIAVGLDDYGPLGIALDELRRAGVIADPKLPWVTSLHDLATICTVVDRAAELLLYVRRRSDSGVATHYRAVDELDLFMLFLEGGLYVEPDPDEVHRLYPMSSPVSSADRRRYAQSARPTRVATFTDGLDAWFYAEGNEHSAAIKPTFSANSWLIRLVDFLSTGKKPGWFRFAADLLALSGAAQNRLESTTRKIVRQTRRDGSPHQMVQSYAGNWGYPTLFAQTRGAGMTRADAVDILGLYMLAKKHQLRSDRSLGLVLNDAGEPEHIVYMNDPPTYSPELDGLGKDMGLHTVDQMVGGRKSVGEPSGRRGKRKPKRRKRK